MKKEGLNIYSEVMVGANWIIHYLVMFWLLMQHIRKTSI